MAEEPSAIICAVTGASGGPIALRLLAELSRRPLKLHLIFSPTGATVFQRETGVEADLASLRQTLSADGVRAELALHPPDDFTAPIASGSVKWEGMVVCPCSLGTAGRIAAGVSDSLIARAADVTLKERRRLVLVPRELPLSTLHLENLLKLARSGAVIVPPLMTFYHRPESVEQHISFLVGRLLDALGLENELVPPWGGQ
jgi:4-hydroxy-3-polyprenylbenzoate decarboxylase